MKRAGIIGVTVGVASVAAFATFATFATGLDRQALRQVVRACVVDFRLTGAPLPCLAVDISGGEDRGYAVLRSPLLHELIVVPTREIVGVEDPYLQSPGAPNYFEASWRARSFLEGADGRAPERGEIALVANSAVVRNQDQLHIHVGCLLPSVRRALAAAAPKVPVGKWARIGAVVPHSMFWGMRIRETDLSDIEPVQLVAGTLSDKVRDRRYLTIVAAGVRVEGDDQLLILASYPNAPDASRPVAAVDLLDRDCPAGRSG